MSFNYYKYSGNYYVPKQMKRKKVVVTPWAKIGSWFFPKKPVRVTPEAPANTVYFRITPMQAGVKGGASPYPLAGVLADAASGLTASTDYDLVTGSGVTVRDKRGTDTSDTDGTKITKQQVETREDSDRIEIDVAGMLFPLSGGRPRIVDHRVAAQTQLGRWVRETLDSFVASGMGAGRTLNASEWTPSLQWIYPDVFKQNVKIPYYALKGDRPLLKLEHPVEKKPWGLYLDVRTTKPSLQFVLKRVPEKSWYSKAWSFIKAIPSNFVKLVGSAVKLVQEAMGMVCEKAQSPLAQLGTQLAAAKYGQDPNKVNGQIQTIVQNLCGQKGVPVKTPFPWTWLLIGAAAVGGAYLYYQRK